MRANSAQVAACLLATTSVLAISVATAQAQVVTNPPTPFTNSGTLNQILFNDGATHTGDVTNASTGAVNFTGSTGAAIKFTNATTLNGNIVNNGTVTATVTGAPHSIIGIDTRGGTVNNIINNGMLTVNGQSGANVGIFTATANSVTNTGTINVNGTFGTNTVGANLGTLSGGFTNSGTMNVTATGRSGANFGVVTGIGFLGVVSGPVVNTGTINLTATPSDSTGGGLASLFLTNGGDPAGGFRNDGTITVQAAAALGATYIFAKKGSFINNGTMNVIGTGSGIGNNAAGVTLIMNLGQTFAGGIVNNGTMNVSGANGPTVLTPFIGGPAAIALSTGLTGQPALPGGGAVTGGITNNGTMNVNGTTGGAVGIGADFIVATGATPFTVDSITNNGTMNIHATASASNGIELNDFVGGVLVVGSILNTGTINATNGIVVGANTTVTNGVTNSGFVNAVTAIDTTNEGSATTINQNGGALNGAVAMSQTKADIFNVTNGTVNGQMTGGANTLVNMTNGTLVVATTWADSVGAFRQTGGTVDFFVTPAVHGSIASINASTRGGTFEVFEASGNYASSQTYTNVLIAPSNTGAYTVTSLSPVFTATLVSNGIGANQNLVLNFNGFSSVTGLTRNEHAVATAIDKVIASNPTGALANFAAQFAPLNAAQLASALDSVSGEIHASVQSVILDDSLYAREALLDRLWQITSADGGAGPMASLGGGGPLLAYADTRQSAFPIKAPPLPARTESDLTFWTQGIGAWGRINSDGNAADVQRDLAGFFTGVDRRFGDWRAGIAAGYTNSSVSVPARASSANVDTAHLGAYAGASYGAWHLRTGADFAWSNISTNRSVMFPGFADSDTASYGAQEGQIFGEVGYGMTFGRIAAEPFGGLAFVHLHTDSFTEAGGGAALIAAGNDDDVGYTNLGVRLASTYQLPNGMIVSPRISASWQHAFGDVTPVAALAFQAPGAGFTVAGVPIARDAALVSAGADVRINSRATLGIGYSGDLASNAVDNSVKGTFSWKF